MPSVIQVGQPIFPESQGIFKGIGVDYQDWNVLGQFITKNIPTLGSDAFANGAIGDGTHDDTAALQQTINNGGVLFLRPNKQFLISQPIVLPQNFSTVFIYGGGFVTANAAITMISSVGGSFNIRITDVVFLANGVGSTCVSIQNNPAGWNTIAGCYLATNAGISLVLNNVGENWTVDRCLFQGNVGISLGATIGNMSISNNDFSHASTPITFTGSPIAFNARGNSTYIDYYGVPQIPRASVYQSVGQSVTTGSTVVLSFATVAFNIGTTPLWAVGNPTRFTAPIAGNYDVLSGYLYSGASAGFGNFEMAIKLNGVLTTAPQYLVSMGGPAGTIAGQQISGNFDLNTADFIEFEINQNTGGTLTTTPASTFGGMVLRSRP